MSIVLPSHVCHLRGAFAGPKVVVFGGTHGDETTGVEVVRTILKQLGLNHDVPSGSHLCPSVTGELFFGIGNPQAVLNDSRSISGIRDLNRCFHEPFFNDPEQMKLPDQARAGELKDLLASADFFIDLHSVSTERSVPFIGLTTFSDRHAKLCAHFPVKYILNVNSILGLEVGIPADAMEQSPTTCSWVNRHDGVGLTYEMGYQKDFTSIAHALQVLLSTLLAIGSITQEFVETIGIVLDPTFLKVPTQEVYRLVYPELNLFRGFQFRDDRYTENWLPVQAGEVIGSYADGQEVSVKQDGLLVFPAGKQTLKTNKTLFYLAMKEPLT